MFLFACSNFGYCGWGFIQATAILLRQKLASLDFVIFEKFSQVGGEQNESGGDMGPLVLIWSKRNVGLT